MLDLKSFQPTGESLAELDAALARIAAQTTASDQACATLTASRAALLLTGTSTEIVELDMEIAKARVDAERLAALRAVIQDCLPAARRAADIDRARVLVEASDAALAEVNAGLGEYAAAAAVIARFAALDHARTIAFRQACYAAVTTGIRYPGADIPRPTAAPANYCDSIALPGVLEPGDDGNAAARKRFWPAPPPPPAPRAPEKVHGPSTWQSYEIRRPSTPYAPPMPRPLQPPAVEWRTLPDYGAE